MTKIIYDINRELKIFYLIIEGRKIGFHLSNRLAKTFFDYLRKGVLVDFEIATKRKKIHGKLYFQVAHFNRIISLEPHRVHYDLYQLRKDMQDVLKQYKYYLFIDFEMTMPGYTSTAFTPEIIQVGYVLSEAQGDIIEQNGYYVLPAPSTNLSKRTKKFLKLDELKFYEDAIHYEKFYEDLNRIIEKYQPKFVVWGKNDITALNDSYRLHHKNAITQDTDFIDLLKLHKDYYNLKDDLGLFKAYKTYFEIDGIQHHDANDDALVTKYVFDAFMLHMQ
jgi:sporulation inhibitor KapD